MNSNSEIKSSKKIITLIKTKNSDFWSSEEKKRSLTLFRQASKTVPSYRDFLKKNHINQKKIKTWKDIQKIPKITKSNYLKKNTIEKLSVNGSLVKPLVFTSTSGSSGEPFYFHRSFELDWQSSVIHELFYLQGSYKKDEPVLVIVCFGMGVWIGGLITYQAFHLIQQRGYNVSLITPGINKEEIFKSIRNLGKLYKNIILAGYPPFVKDVIDEAPSHGIDWRKFRVRLLFAAEIFTEGFREYVCRATNIKNPLLDTMNIYGTADLGTMAFETPLAILVRRLCIKNRRLFEIIFNNIKKTPTLCQFIPQFTLFSLKGEDILVSGNNTIPLINYSLGDHGGIYAFSDIIKKCVEVGVDLKKEIKKNKIKKFCYELPFVYVYERKDLSAKLYGATIYPEHIRHALSHSSLTMYLTGKFIVATKYDIRNNQYMEINCELKKEKNSSSKLRKIIKKVIIKELLKKNAEYANNYKSIPKKVEPYIVLWPYEHPIYFKSGTKQKWVAK